MTARPYRVWGPIDGRASIQAGVDALTVINLQYLREKGAPRIFSSGVRYRREPRTVEGYRREDFLSIPYVISQGYGDCEDLSAWLSAALIDAGERARAVVVPVTSGYHVVVRRADGSVIDPSARLGMLDR